MRETPSEQHGNRDDISLLTEDGLNRMHAHLKLMEEHEALFKPCPVYASTNVIHQLRHEPLEVSEDQAIELLGITGIPGVPSEYIHNTFERQETGILDHATRLMWLPIDEEEAISYAEAYMSIGRLNQERVGWYENWRLPTIPELTSLLEPGKRAREKLLHTTFGVIPREFYRCWSADTVPVTAIAPPEVWCVELVTVGCVSWPSSSYFTKCWVWAVRSGGCSTFSEPSIILRCARCGQRVRIPHRNTKLKVTCPSCRDVWYVKQGERI